MRNFDEALSAATTLPMPPVPGAPTRLPVDPFTCYAAEGFVKGLHELAETPRLSVEKFAERLEAAMPKDLRIRLRNPAYQMPDELWDLINELTIEEQSRIIYTMISHIHMCEALYVVLVLTPEDEDPLERFRGREHLALVLPLAGEGRFMELLERAKPLLSRFGLDKGQVRDRFSNSSYPTARKRFFKERDEFFRDKLMENREILRRFVKNPREKVSGWPEDLCIFYMEEDVERALDQVQAHYH